MPDKVGRFTVQEQRFAEWYARTGDATYSAAKAGYASPQPRGSANLQKPAVMDLVRQVRERLRTKGAEVGVRVLIELAEGKDNPVPAGVRRAAASDLVKHSGIAVEDSAEHKEPHEMTSGELDRARDVLLNELAARAKPVIDAVPITPGVRSSSSVFD